MFTINKTLLVCFCLSLFSSIAFAQRGAIELAAGGGVSMNNAPTANMPFTGTSSPLNYVTQFNAVYNLHRNIAAGIEIRSSELSRTTDSVYSPLIYGDGKKLVYSDMMITACAIVNGKVNVMRGYFYGGLAAGYATSLHDQTKLRTTSEIYRAPNDGKGFVWGIQGGFTYGINSFMGIYAEAALRTYHINHSNSLGTGLLPITNPNTELSYNITAYNLTVGVKFRIMPPRRVQNDIPGMRGQGRSL